MAWGAGRGRARGWLLAVVGAGCTAPNPAYEAGDPTSEVPDDAGATVGTSAATTGGAADATTNATTTNAGTGEAGSESGVERCEDPSDGTPVTVYPTDHSEQELCGLHETRTGRLVLSGDQYVLHLAGECMEGSEVTVVFAPTGPSLSAGEFLCVSFELGYRPDCTFESATIRESVTEALVFAAASVPQSHVGELTLALGDPEGEVCNCQLASCCDGAPAPGLYSVDASTSMGDSAMLGQGAQVTFNSGPAPYELGMPRARVTNDCEAPVQVDWYFRRVDS
jgi:hypothetical protein